jgi:RHS repeat-associated protein
VTLNGVATTMTYDGEGRRVKKQDGASRTTVMVYGIGGEVAEEYETGGAPGTGGTQYVAVDHLGSTRMVFDSAGNPVRCMDFVPFGEEIPQGVGSRAGACWGTAAEPKVRFTGKERDAETGLDWFATRYLSSAQGRFSSHDEFPWWNLQHSEKEADKKQFADYIGNPQNWNMYAYVLNNPLNHTDPTGMLGCQVGDQKYAVCKITVVYNPETSKGTLTVTGQNKGDKKATVLMTGSVVVGGDGHVTPTGNFHAGNWQKDATTNIYGWQASTPWSKSALGLNAFGPYQLHIKELEGRGIWIHGTMGPGWSPTTSISGIAVSQTSHGCVRTCNSDNLNLHKIMPDPVGNPIKISTNPHDAPEK